MTNHLVQTSAGVVILLMNLQMCGQILDSLGENGNLNLRRTGISFVKLVCFDDCGLFFLKL